MRNLLYKEFRISIHALYFVIPFLTGALFLIPNWLFFIALMYFFFISVPNIHSAYNSQNDNAFSIMMPVSKREIVKARILAIMTLESFHLLAGAFYAFLNITLYKLDNFSLDLNLAFFGIAFTMFAVFNIIFFPLYYKTAYNFGFPTILATGISIVYVEVIEVLVIINPTVADFLEGKSSAMRVIQAAILAFGIIAYLASSYISYRISAKRFENIDL
jgi:ABC-2 type transport system permease protein